MLFLILLFKLTLAQQYDSEILELQIEKRYEFYGKVPGSSTSVLYPVHFYKFLVENVIPNEDIFVVLRALHDQSSFPALYISKVNEYPTLYDDLCGNEGMDVCVIEEQDLIANTTYYLGVYCLQDCDYELTIHYEEEEVLSLGDAIIVKFENETESILKIGMPSSMDSIDRILIRAHYVQDKNTQLNESFHFYINEGNETPSPSQNQYEAEEIWMIGKGVVIYKNSTNLKGNLTVLLIGAPYTKLYFLSSFYELVRDLGLFERTDDLVIQSKTNYYKLTIQDEYIQFLNGNSLSFDIHPFEGNPDLYISPCQQDECSLDYKLYPWQSKLDLGYESITISSNNRINAGNGTKFIIAINGQGEFSSYSFFAYLSNYYSRILSLYSFESGFLVKNELAEYIVGVFDQNNQTFTISANYPTGQGMIILKKCIKNNYELSQVENSFAYIENAGPDNYYNCSITKDQIEKIQIGQVLQSGSSEMHSSENTLQFYYNKTECESNVTMLLYENIETNCQYVIGVYSYVEQMNYQIFIKGQEQHIELRESTTHRSYLMEYDTDLYSFTIQEDEITEIVFQITAISGEYDAYSSRIYEKPNSSFYDRYANMELDVLQYKTDIVTQNLTGTYYIRIFAKALLRYTITPLVYRLSHDQINYIHLTESIPYTHLQTNIDQITYFNFEYRQNGPLYIHLNGIYGYFISYVIGTNKVIDDKFPNQTLNDFTLRSSQHTLIIENPKQYYYVQVSSISLGLNESYEIQFTSSSSLMELFYGDPLITQLDNLHQSYYYYQSPYNLEKLFIVRTYITETNEDNYLRIFISTKNKFPNNESFEYQITDSQTYLTLSNITQNSILYIGLQSFGCNEFSLIIRGASGITELLDNTVQQVPIPSFEQYQQSNLYFLVPKNLNNTIQIQAYTEFTEIELFCSIKDYSGILKELKNNNHSIFPSSSNYDIEEEISASISNKLLIIEQEDLKNCQNYKQGCVLLITVKLDQKSLFSYIFGNSYNNITTVDGEDGYFNIMISTQYTIIRNGEMLIGYSGENIMSYYYFYVDIPVEFIQIAARPLEDCDPDIYVNKLINDTISYPTEDSNTYKSISYKSDVLIIRESDNLGSYIIGVSGFRQECTYELLLNFADIELYYISNGQLISHHINQTVYYFYQHIRKESFRIMIQGMNDVDVAINTYSQYRDNDDGLFDLLPYYGTDDIQIMQEHNNNLFGGIIQINISNKNFCYYCTYIIALKPLKNADVQLLIAYNQIALEIEYGRIYYDQCVEICKYYVEPGDLNIYVYSQSIELNFYNEDTFVFSMNLTNTQHIIPINSSYTLNIVNSHINTISSYCLSLQSEQNLVALHLGKSFKGNHTEESNQTQFTFNPLTIDKWYTIIVNSKSIVKVEMFYMSKNVSEFVLINPVQEWSISKSQLELKYQLLDANYFYKIVLQCLGAYSITINLDGLKYIDSNNHYIEQVQFSQNYNLFGIKGQELMIEKIDCLGQTESNISYYQFKNSTDIYFNITPIQYASYTKDGLSIKKNIYSLVPHLQYSHDLWYFNNTIKYQVEQNQDETLTVIVDTMKRNKTGILDLKLIIYQLHYSNQESFMQAFGCQMDIESLKYYTTSQLYHSKSLQTIKEEDQKVSFKVPLPQDQKILFGLIVFQAFYQGYDTPYTYFYNVSLIYNQSQIDKNMNIEVKEEVLDENYILIIIILAIIFIILVLFVGIRKAIQKKQQLKLGKPNNKIVEEECNQMKTV